MSDLKIECRPNGPLIVQGPIELTDPTGKVLKVDRAKVALCRCGHSGNKPFCDGRHNGANFQAAEPAKV